MTTRPLAVAVVDTSALVAILENEASAAAFLTAFEACHDLRMSAATHLELTLVVRAKKGGNGLTLLDELLRALRIGIEPFTYQSHGLLARMGAIHFGKGVHPAALNFGDLFSYATALALDAPLFFQGFDFRQTDVRDAMQDLGDPFSTGRPSV